MHSPINVLVNFNEFINKHINLQNITLDELFTNVININHWPFVHIHATTLHLHCIIYDSNTLKTKNLPNDIV
jgi:hypothetical protein